MGECAFCPHTGKLSLEHIISQWTAELFPGKIIARRTDRDTGEVREWKCDSVDLTAKVVCENCNNTWMSEIESQHAKPVLTPLITGELDIPIGLTEARSIALFSFKTAVILDHANRRGQSPFFDSNSRYLFREKLAIPISVQMWLCGFIKHRGDGRFITLYHQPESFTGENWLMYVCTFAIGNLALQVVAVKDKTERAIFRPTPGFEYVAVPFWPELHPKYIWPGVDALRSPEDFNVFASRWQNIELIS
jgi:hypothetical protein